MPSFHTLCVCVCAKRTYVAALAMQFCIYLACHCALCRRRFTLSMLYWCAPLAVTVYHSLFSLHRFHLFLISFFVSFESKFFSHFSMHNARSDNFVLGRFMSGSSSRLHRSTKMNFESNINTNTIYRAVN